MDINQTGNIRKLMTLLAIACFLCSLLFDCFCTADGCIHSTNALITGWLGLFGGSSIGLCWLANPLIIICVVLTFRSSKYSLSFSLIATALCLSFLLIDKIPIDEAGNYRKIINYKLGYWLWCTSATMLAIGNLFFPNAKPIEEVQQ